MNLVDPVDPVDPCGRPGWRFAGRPRWIISHVLVIAMVVLMVELGFWQVRRLEGRRQVNAMLAARMDAPAAPLARLVRPDTPVRLADHLELRRVTVSGRYDPADQVVVGPESDAEGNPGWWLATPLVLGDHTAVIVVRGLIPYDAWTPQDPTSAGRALTGFAPPSGTVTVTGLVAEGQPRQEGVRDPGSGRLPQLSRLDLARYQRQLPERIDPVAVDLSPGSPGSGAPYPQPLPGPALGDGPHLSYAIQWFSFALITVLLYPVLLWRQASGGRRRRRRRPRPTVDG